MSGVFRKRPWGAYYRRRKFVSGIAAQNTNVLANTTALSLSELQAALSLDVDVVSAADSLTLSDLAASVSVDVAVSANTAALALSGNQSALSLDVDVASVVDGLTLATYQSSVVTSSVNITDVNTTESWADGATGLVITGTGFV